MAKKKRVKSKGLGDTVEKVLKATGIDKIAKFVLGEDCGCDERKALLNKLYPYQKPECLIEGEYDILDKHFKKYPDSTTGTLRAELLRELYSIYNRVMHQSKVPSNCPSCVRNVLSSLKNIYLTYEDK
tara:strand:- start:517 stop:900 length:384 start_codon:yes stop_codon:yes gene_type:complete